MPFTVSSCIILPHTHTADYRWQWQTVVVRLNMDPVLYFINSFCQIPRILKINSQLYNLKLYDDWIQLNSLDSAAPSGTLKANKLVLKILVYLPLKPPGGAVSLRVFYCLPFVLSHACVMWPFTLKERHKLCGSKNKVLQKISGPEMDEGTFMNQTGHVEVTIINVLFITHT